MTMVRGTFPALFENDRKMLRSQLMPRAKGKKPPVPKGKRAKGKIEKVMHEFKEGSLKSSSGDPVKDPRQAKAIAFSEARKVGQVHKTTAAMRAAARKKAGR